MAVVVFPHADHRQPGPGRLQPSQVGSGGAMMGNLEHIGGEGPEVGLGRPFHISGEENPGGSRRYPEDDRLIVDAFVAALRTGHYQ